MKKIESGKYEGFSVNIEGTIVISPSNNVLKIKEKTNQYGGLRICIECIINKKHKTISVAQLVATAFISNPDNKPYVIHKDGSHANNYVKNLEWATRYEMHQNNLANGRYKIDAFKFTNYNNPKKKNNPVIHPLTGNLISVFN